MHSIKNIKIELKREVSLYPFVFIKGRNVTQFL